MKCYCFFITNPKNKKPIKICFCPPALIVPWWRWRKPGPDPFHWVEIEGVKPKELDDLVILSALSELTEQLTPAFAKRLQGPLAEVLRARLESLPVEVTIEQG